MKVTEILAASREPYPSIEIVPPKKGLSKEELFKTLEPFARFNPPYINVTCHRDEYEYREEPDGTFSRHLVRKNVGGVAVCAAVMSRFESTLVPHVICAGATADEIESELFDMKFLGIDNVLALRGDAALGEKRFTQMAGGYSHADELVEAIRAFGDKIGWSFCIGVAGYPEKHSEAANIETDIENLKRKVDAGADYIVTQMFFDNEKYYRWSESVRKAGIDVPLIPGLKPLSTRRQLDLLPKSFGIDIPLELSRKVAESGDDKEKAYRAGIDWCIAQTKDLLSHGAPSVHYFTMGKADNVTEILESCFKTRKDTK